MQKRSMPHGYRVATRSTALASTLAFLSLTVCACAPLCAAVKHRSRRATYTNPVLADGHPIHMCDPFAFRADGKYYLTGTTSEHEGFQMYRSPDLIHWKYVGWALKKTPTFWADGLFWAPEVHRNRGKYYMIYSGHVRGSTPPRLLLGLAVSDRPEGPYRNLRGPWFDAGYSAIDGDMLTDRDGTPYLYFSRNGAQDGYAYGKIYGVQLASGLSKPVGKPVELLEASQPWERVNWAHNRCNEGPTVFRHGKKYYMSYSANDTSSPNYGIGYAIASNPLGPWKKGSANPVLATNKAVGASGPGHNSLVLSPDGKEMFIVYHTHADANHPSMDRVVNIDRVHISSSGILTVDGPTRSPQPMPSGTTSGMNN